MLYGVAQWNSTATVVTRCVVGTIGCLLMAFALCACSSTPGGQESTEIESVPQTDDPKPAAEGTTAVGNDDPHPDVSALCRSSADPSAVTRSVLEEWGTDDRTVYLCTTNGSWWWTDVVAPLEEGMTSPTLLERFDPAGPIEGCEEEGEWTAYLTDLTEVYGTPYIGCDMMAES